MKNVVLTSLLVASSVAFVAPKLARAQAADGQVQMSAEEYKAYNDANSATTPAAKAAGFEAYLKAYPKSAVKAQALEQILFAYVQSNDPADAETAGDNLLAVDPNNLRAYVIEVQLHRDAADKLTDPAAKEAAYDKAADYAQRGLKVIKKADETDADFKALEDKGFPIFYSVIGTDDLAKKDNADAITAFKSELSDVPVAQTETPGLQLQDTFYLAQAYYTSTPPDYLNCTYYAARAAAFAPPQYATSFTALAKYCYAKYHGAQTGYDAAVAGVKDNLMTPATFTITPAPKPIDYVKQIVTPGADLSKLALSDREFVLQYGNVADPSSATQMTYSDEVFAPVKGKEVQVPGALVVAATSTQLQVAVSDDSTHATPPVADFTFNFAEPLKTVPAVGTKVDVLGTYTSYTSSPLMIIMDNARIAEKAAPARRPAPRHR